MLMVSYTAVHSRADNSVAIRGIFSLPIVHELKLPTIYISCNMR